MLLCTVCSGSHDSTTPSFRRHLVQGCLLLKTLFQAKSSAVLLLLALLQVKSNSSLARSRALGKGSRTTERTSRGLVANAHHAHFLDIANLALADHAFGHLDLDFVISVGRQRKTEQSRARCILGNLGALESLVVGAA